MKWNLTKFVQELNLVRFFQFLLKHYAKHTFSTYKALWKGLNILGNCEQDDICNFIFEIKA